MLAVQPLQCWLSGQPLKRSTAYRHKRHTTCRIPPYQLMSGWAKILINAHERAPCPEDCQVVQHRALECFERTQQPENGHRRPQKRESSNGRG